MKIQWKKLIGCIALPLAVGGASALLSSGGMEAFALLKQPPLSPPAWLFPVVWTILYVLMGIASYLMTTSDASDEEKSRAWTVYGVQLGFNFFWSILFFNFRMYFFAFFWLLALWALILVTIRRFWVCSKTSGYLLLPYLVWVTFAGYLNLAIAILN